jgi:hypothetical protein
MARIQLDWRVWRARLAACLWRVAPSVVADEAAEAAVEPRAPCGPGWFDSSWELVRGLEVTESCSGDVRLDAWLEACIETCIDAASAVTERDEEPGAGLVPAPPHGAFGNALQFGDLDLGVAAEVTHLDQFSEFGIDQLELV